MLFRHWQEGRLEVICGCMFSGKTSELFRRVRRAQTARLQVLVFRHALSDQHDMETLVSHNGFGMRSLEVAHSSHIPGLIDARVDMVAIDEGQFFDDGIVDVCRELADRGKFVIVAGLDTDYRGEPFGPMPLLMAEAEEVDKLTAPRGLRRPCYSLSALG